MKKKYEYIRIIDVYLLSMLFKEVIGQESVKERLRNMYIERRIPHAMLFSGPEGAGVLPLAIAFATYINCTGDKSHGDACGVCPSCVKMSKLVHPDLHFSFPIVLKSSSSVSSDYLAEWREMIIRQPYFNYEQWSNEFGELKKPLIPVKEAQEIHRSLRLSPFEGQFQVMLIWKVELMNESAANRILKILEEPPANTIFLLVSEKSAEILPTILSRTQVIGVPPIANEDMKTHLRSDLLLDEGQAERVAHIAQGCKVKAQSIVEGSELSKANLSFFVELMRSCYSGKDNVPRMVTLCESMQKKSREQVKNMLIYSLRMLRESFVRNLDNTELCYTTKEEETFLEKFCPYVHLDNIFDMSEVFNKAIANIEQNGNVRMVMMDLQLNLAVLFRRPRPNEEIAEVV